ncbi:ShlB/FhaC/HecB family hemolysin secretion/activation protein [Sphingomonas sp.]|uniref:ShlB/FhaC/HecB family hemolysin secretion/activation protein n=1 Tax=Sphingomonas sp. TaxID=28214 RepID=UPI00286DB178|nr:ShlB/FhaC/HecB family hemolysin secretion/activation protein [Sphingomonas sp.]
MTRALMFAALLSTSQSAFAQQRPDAGQQLVQIPAIPPVQRREFDIRVAPPPATATAAQADSGQTVRVDALRVTGHTLFSEPQLLAAVAFVPGTALSLTQLRAIAAQITRFYNDRGYFLAQAYLPVQDIAANTVTFTVVEGRYDGIAVNNQAGLSRGLARGALAGLASGDRVSSRPLERRLLLLSDIPGVEVTSTLSPGGAVGSSDLLVNLRQRRLVSGMVEADNGGNRFTGAYRAGGSVNFNNPTGHGDQLSVRALASDSGLAYGRAAYQTLLGDTTIGVAFSHIEYTLGREFRALDADGTANVATFFASHPVVRSRNTNLNLLAGVDAKFFKDRVGAASTVSRRRAKVANLGLSGNHRDHFGGGGSTVFSVGAALGDLDIRSPADRAFDRLTARTSGGYAKFQAGVARLQRLTEDLSLFVSVRGQLASKNLDSAEKMELGGAYAVRAYPEGEGYGDEGYVATAEARYQLLRLLPVPGDFQLFGFVDAGAVKFAKNPWFAGPNVARRSGIGAGMGWTLPNNFMLKATYAHKLGNQRVTSQRDRDGRFWFQLAKVF